MTFMITQGLRELVERDWDAVRDLKDRYWSERIRRLGAQEAFRIAEELRRQALAYVPSWPHPEERANDLEAHVHLAELLRRASPISSD
ncbi:MAG: hypothetical protein DMF56_16375 [Acidobacteria bacterium]|nr:MAG: hypothetical protein DMF56_16375 [Acidobacteriota bacterium]